MAGEAIERSDGAALARRTRWTAHLYVQVLIGIALGVTLGAMAPELGTALKPIADAFIKIIKMLISPIIFVTVVTGIAKMGDLGAIGRVGLKALIYFEAVTTLALVIGLVVVNLVRPGAGIDADPATLDASAVAQYAGKAGDQSTVEFLLNVIPDTVVSAFVGGDLLQVLFVAILFGVVLARLGERGRGVTAALDTICELFFGIIGLVMRLAPIGAFAAMAFTIGRYGLDTLAQLAALRVTGAGFITLAATLSAIDTVPVAGIALILGVDRFMSEARAITNLIGNGVATLAIAKWEGALDATRLRQALAAAPDTDGPVLIDRRDPDLD